MEKELETFGKVFIEEVRDRSIRIFDKKINGLMKDECSRLLYERIRLLSDDEKKIIYDLIPNVVDLCLHNMLCLFEEHDEFKIFVDEENINMASDGLAGELYTSDGWIAKYSEQRHTIK